MDAKHFQELLARARSVLAAAKQKEEEEAAQALELQINATGVHTVDMTKTGIDDESLKSDAGREAAVEVITEILSVSTGASTKIYGVAKAVTLNDKQQAFNTTVQSGADCVLIGAAGTGKTTSMRQVTIELLNSGRIIPITSATKWLNIGSPGAAILSYTRKAVNNIRHAVAEELKANTLTIHKILEFAPVFYEIDDPDKPGYFKKTMRFEPTRCATNPLPAELRVIAFEESSMISVELYKLLQDAMPHAHQEIFLGDIQQLPPIFGLAILGFKMTELPVIELTEVYRQALESPIINLAWKILEGNPHDFSGKTEEFDTEQSIGGKLTKVRRKRAPALDRFSCNSESGEVKFQIWQKKLTSDHALITATKQFTTWADQHYYDPQDDIILCPFNKAFGTVELNKGIAQHLGRKRGAIIHEVIAGFHKHYLAIGDRVLYDKEDAFIVSISHNGNYLGKRPLPASEFLDRWGHLQQEMTEAEKATASETDSEMDMEAIENFMNAAVDSNEERVQVASHIIKLRFAYGDEEVELDTASEVNNLLGGYAITVHKAQGSEYDRVFLLLHNTHVMMVSRELLYTGVTRAKKFLHVIAEVDSFEKGVKSQRIKGDTINEKAEFFKGKVNEYDTRNGVSTADTENKHSVKTTIISGRPAVKLSDLVTEEIRNQCQERLEHHWQRAVSLFGASVGEKPQLAYDKIRSSKVVGRAYLQRGVIAINPVWLAIDEASIRDGIFNETIPHEICHFTASRLEREFAHGAKWKLHMIKMGLTGSRLHTSPLPPWAAAKDELLRKVLLDSGASTVETENDETDTEEEVS